MTRKSVIDLTWSSSLDSPLGLWSEAEDDEETGSDHRVIFWETRDNPIMNTPPKIVE
jgi:hypothetical protein